MNNLEKFTLEFNESNDNWELKKDVLRKVIKTFKTKKDAISNQNIKKTLGEKGGSVKIQKRNGRFQEERTFPKSKDPRKSKG